MVHEFSKHRFQGKIQVAENGVYLEAPPFTSLIWMCVRVFSSRCRKNSVVHIES